MTINNSQVNTDEDPGLKELFSVDTFPRVMLWSKRFNKLFCSIIYYYFVLFCIL